MISHDVRVRLMEKDDDNFVLKHRQNTA